MESGEGVEVESTRADPEPAPLPPVERANAETRRFCELSRRLASSAWISLTRDEISAAGGAIRQYLEREIAAELGENPHAFRPEDLLANERLALDLLASEEEMIARLVVSLLRHWHAVEIDPGSLPEHSLAIELSSERLVDLLENRLATTERILFPAMRRILFGNRD